jgi:glycosyltransferase involved in cell wall biosynthesis
MFAEVPVIATAVGGVPEAVNDGETGFLVPPGAVEKLGECIDYLLSYPDERERMGRRGLELAQRRFSREKWLSKYANVLHELSHSSS